jgi:hypothetical protein
MDLSGFEEEAMNRLFLIAAFVGTLGFAIASAQTSRPQRESPTTAQSGSVPTRAMTLAMVHIPRAVKADDKVLRAGTYTVRLTGEQLKATAGETPNLEQWVEFLQGGKVKGKAVVSIVPPDQIHQVAEERVPSPGHARVDVLKGNDYVRVWINKGGDSYLIHLPTGTS